MNWRRVRTGDWLTGAWGVALLAVMFADWYTVLDGSFSAWQAFGFVDKLLALLGLLAVAVPIVTAARESPSWPVAIGVLTVALALITVPFVLFRVLDPPHDADTAWGAWAGLICVLGVLVAAWFSIRTEDAPAIRQSEITPMPTPER